MNQVTEHIWIGNFTEVDTYSMRPFQAIMNCTPENEVTYTINRRVHDFLRIGVADCFPIGTHYMDEAMKFLDKHVESNHKIYAHCIAGISRSPSIVAAYLSLANGLSLSESFKYLVSLRRQVFPDPNVLSSVASYVNSHKDKFKLAPSPLLLTL
jgi:hypothetical protein